MEPQPARTQHRPEPRALLLVGDRHELAPRLLPALGHLGWEYNLAPGIAAAMQRTDRRRYDALLSGYKLEDGNGLTLARMLGDDLPALSIWAPPAADAQLRRLAAAAGYRHVALLGELDLATLAALLSEADPADAAAAVASPEDAG